MVHRMDSQYEEMEWLIILIEEIREYHPTMGVRDLYYKIRPTCMGRDAFERFCMYENLMARRARNRCRTTDSSGVHRYDNLLVNLIIDHKNQVWQSDITYFEVSGAFYYITFIIDAYTRYIVGYSVSKTLKTEDTTIPALKMAISNRRGENLEGLIFHSDGGGQYYSRMFIELTSRHGILNSMCVEPWENGKAERINGVIKNNYLIYRSIKTYDDLVKEVDRAVRLYNTDKPHIKLKRLTPFEFEKSLSLQSEKNKDKTDEFGFRKDRQRTEVVCLT